MPSIRKFLDLSTAHLPKEIMETLPHLPGVVAHATDYGAFLWVPNDPVEGLVALPPHVVLGLQVYARSLDCDYVLLDADGPIDDHLPTWEW